ncbi:MAG: ATP-dependent protease ATPase subunit HslU [Spirochaetales bacterium]|nr:ATP-dependent protease ATPase subunit HslU [Spirochaetales bacterium]
MNNVNLDALTPSEIVKELDKYIIGQNKAKKAVAIALRNRYRRQLLPADLRDEIAPKNIIMIGPTGVGKTEIARRLAKLCGAPFLKVEATKYTEVGYVGRDVESMVRDLMATAVSMVKYELKDTVKEAAEKRTEEALLELLLPGSSKPPVKPANVVANPNDKAVLADDKEELNQTREFFRKKLRDGEFEEREVELSIASNSFPSVEVFSGTGFEEMDFKFGNIAQMFGGGGKKKKKMSISKARQIIFAEETDKLIDQDNAVEIAKERVQQMGIIFIDEIDKIAVREKGSGADVSREGVQRDILPIVEGSKVNTKFGIIDTSHILFIAAGAFHISKPSDLIPELQGRFPIRVELDDLNKEEFYMILTQPQNALIKQYKALIATEEVTLDFVDDAVRRISEIAEYVNTETENIGARRLHTIMELLLEEISFSANELKGQTIKITKDYVDEKIDSVSENKDLSRYIL